MVKVDEYMKSDVESHRIIATQIKTEEDKEKYVLAQDLGTCRIIKVEEVEVDNQYFKGKKLLIEVRDVSSGELLAYFPNKTSVTALVEGYKSKDSKDWIGNQIQFKVGEMLVSGTMRKVIVAEAV